MHSVVRRNVMCRKSKEDAVLQRHQQKDMLEIFKGEAEALLQEQRLLRHLLQNVCASKG